PANAYHDISMPYYVLMGIEKSIWFIFQNILSLEEIRKWFIYKYFDTFFPEKVKQVRDITL
ncbi:hypothetical protein LCGC14_2456000, partial [marine sediment metagenome]